MVDNLHNTENEQWKPIKDSVRGIPIQLNAGIPDIRIWKNSLSGPFSINSAYEPLKQDPAQPDDELN